METVFDNGCLVVHTDTLTALLVSDIHLGFHDELSKLSGVSFPSEHRSMLKKLKIMIKKHSVSALYIIGDLKHTISPDSSFNWQTIPDFMTQLSENTDVVLIPGNHDGAIESLLPRNVTVADVRGVVLCGTDDCSIGLVHGHAWPSPEVLRSRIIVIGHSHPSLTRTRVVSARLPGRQARRRYAGPLPVILRSGLDKNCLREKIGILHDDEDSEGVLITLPSFNTLISGLPLNQQGAKLQGPLFESGCVDLPTSEVYSIDGVFLGSVEFLQAQSNETIK